MRRYQRLNDEGRREMMSAFEHARTRLEVEHGEIHTWASVHKAAIAQQVLKTAKEGYAYAPNGACGVALVGLYLEAQTLHGAKANRLVHLIDEWHVRVTNAGASR